MMLGAGGWGRDGPGSAPPGAPEALMSPAFLQCLLASASLLALGLLRCLPDRSVPGDQCLQRIHGTAFNFLNAYYIRELLFRKSH